MKYFSIVLAACSAMALSGCMGSSTADPVPAQAPQPAKVKKNDVVFNYSAGGRTYRLHTRDDTLLRAHGTDMTVVSGPAFTGATSEDALAQNTIRDAFRAQGICKDGQHPGILQFGYGYSTERGAWAAKVRCSEKRQANI